MEKILITGATGALGLELTKAIYCAGYPIRAMMHDKENLHKVKPYTNDIFIADARKPHQLKNLCKGISVLISTVGKSISLFKKDPGTYDDIDYGGNKNILLEAEKSGVERVIFISILGSGPENKLKLSQVHFRVEEIIAKKFKNFTVFKPAGFYSGLNDLIILGKRGVIPIIGSGNALTNSIHQKDLANVIQQMVFTGPEVLEIGGPEIHTRKEMAEMIKGRTGGKIIHIPHLLVKGSISMIWPIKPSLFHNLDYFRYVTSRDMIGQSHGKLTFQDYLNELDLNNIP